MELQLDQKKLFYFKPGESEPAYYAIEHNEDDHYERFIEIRKEDRLSYEKQGDVYLVKIGDKEVDTAQDNLKKLKKIAAAWNSAIDGTEAVALDNEDEGNLKEFLIDNQTQFIEHQNLKFRYLTWNLKGDQKISDRMTTAELRELLGEDMDLYFFAFQEVIPLSTKNLKSSNVPLNNWKKNIFKILDSEQYEVIQTNKLLGLGSILISKKSLVGDLQDIEISSIGTGFLNLYGNKGSILTRLNINGTYNGGLQVNLLNCHFAAGESPQLLEKRRKELFGVGEYFKLRGISNGELVSDDLKILFDVDIDQDTVDNLKDFGIESDDEIYEISDAESTTEPTTEDEQTPPTSMGTNYAERKGVIFIGGDLNYRISASSEIIYALLKEKDYKSLLDYDSLSIEKGQGRILSGFKEGSIDFPPTYKLNSDSTYDDLRKPSYTDRVFHSESKNIEILKYTSIQNTNKSDHKPVISDFLLKDVPIVNPANREELVKAYFKKLDDKVNETSKLRTMLEIKDLENIQTVPILRQVTIPVLIKNTSPRRITWEIVDSENKTIQGRDKVALVIDRIAPSQKGIIPSQGEQILRVSTTLPIGVKEYQKTLILRCNDLQDYFIIVKFVAQESYFGSTIDDLNRGKHSKGIPKPLYTLINYLTNNLTKDMFDEDRLSYTHDLEKKIIRWIDEDKDLETEQLEKANELIQGSASNAVAKVLLLLLRNLDGGIVSNDLSTFLLESQDNDIMESILGNIPPLRANVLIYLTSFLRLCQEIGGIPIGDILNKFQSVLVQVPKSRKRDMFSKCPNYEKLRTEFLKKLLS